MGKGPSAGEWATSQGQHLWRNLELLPQQLDFEITWGVRPEFGINPKGTHLFNMHLLRVYYMPDSVELYLDSISSFGAGILTQSLMHS